MKLILSIVVFFIFQLSFSQTILGKWKTVDDETGMEAEGAATPRILPMMSFSPEEPLRPPDDASPRPSSTSGLWIWSESAASDALFACHLGGV